MNKQMLKLIPRFFATLTYLTAIMANKMISLIKLVISLINKTTLAVDKMTLSEDKTILAVDRKSTRLNSSHIQKSRMPSSA